MDDIKEVDVFDRYGIDRCALEDELILAQGKREFVERKFQSLWSNCNDFDDHVTDNAITCVEDPSRTCTLWNACHQHCAIDAYADYVRTIDPDLKVVFDRVGFTTCFLLSDTSLMKHIGRLVVSVKGMPDVFDLRPGDSIHSSVCQWKPLIVTSITQSQCTAQSNVFGLPIDSIELKQLKCVCSSNGVWEVSGRAVGNNVVFFCGAFKGFGRCHNRSTALDPAHGSLVRSPPRLPQTGAEWTAFAINEYALLLREAYRTMENDDCDVEERVFGALKAHIQQQCTKDKVEDLWRYTIGPYRHVFADRQPIIRSPREVYKRRRATRVRRERPSINVSSDDDDDSVFHPSQRKKLCRLVRADRRDSESC